MLTEEIINEIEDRSIEVIHSEREKEKEWRKWKEPLRSVGHCQPH